MEVANDELAAVKAATGCRPDQLFGTWAMDATHFQRLLDVVQGIDLDKLRQRSMEERLERLKQRRQDKADKAESTPEDEEDEEPPLYTLLPGGIAAISVSGPLTKYPTSFQSILGGTSTVRVREALRAASRDPEVLGIVLLVESPGGTVAGLHDLYVATKAADRVKPVYAHIEDQAASGGLYAAIGARRVTANANAVVGSIGAFTVVKDTSGAYEARGVKVWAVSSAPPHKGAGADGTKVTDEQLAEFERYIKDVADVFVTDVADGRRVPKVRIEALHTGQQWIAEKALGFGLIDGVCSLDEAVARLRSEAMANLEQDLVAAQQLAEEAEARAEAEKAQRVTAQKENDELRARVAELEKASAPPTDPMAALLANATPEQKLALERVQADAAEAAKLRSEQRLSTFVAIATEIGAGSKLPIKADALGAILLRAEDNALTAADRKELDRLLRAGAAASVVGKEVGSGQDLPAGGNAYERATAMAKALVQDGKEKNQHAALERVWKENPELYAEHRAQRGKSAA